VLGVPKSGIPKDGLSCNWCGYVNLPPEPEAKPVAAAATSKQKVAEAPAPTNPKVKAPPHKWADDVDDNGEPYELPPEEVKTRPCANCKKDIDIIAVVCVHCGYDSESQQKVERTFQPIDLEWESGWRFSTRIAILLAMQVMNGMTLVFGLAVGGTLPCSLGAMAFYLFLQAFLLGTYESVRIRRNRRGQAEITITWRVAFIPQPAKKINWKEHEGVAVGHYDAGSIVDWIVCLLLLPYFIIPAILWWYYMIKCDRFYAALCRDRGYPETYLYRGLNEKQAKDIAQIATDATGLPLTTPL
jgi:hypothetical protein